MNYKINKINKQKVRQNSMKRVNNLFNKIISYENLYFAIQEVNKSHRWLAMGKPNQKVLWVENNINYCVEEIRNCIINGFVPQPTLAKRRYDRNAKKWRDINEPRLYPDQYVHHALIQVLEPIFMRGMDDFCCGSIKGRGTIYGAKKIEKWVRTDIKGTRWCGEFDIYHFYEQLTPAIVMKRMRKLIKDAKTLDLIERVMLNDVTIGAYFSQWFANVTLQELDHKLRESGIGITHYLRFIDNMTVFSNRKRSVRKAMILIEEWLNEHGMKLNHSRQYFRTDKRMPNALGYRYSRKKTYLRKNGQLNIKRQIAQYERKKKHGAYVSCKSAQSMLSRLGRLTHCNNYLFKKKYIRKGLEKELKAIVRDYYKRKEILEWNTCLEQYKKMILYTKLLELNNTQKKRLLELMLKSYQVK